MLLQVISRTQQFWVFQQPNKALKIKFSDRGCRDKISRCHDRKGHEGKTPRSVLRGLVPAQECALLVIFRIHDRKKILMDTLGTSKITRVHNLVSPKVAEAELH
jgi:hypothetical protein